MKVKKSTEITNAKIDFVSLVDKAANKTKFILAKSEDGSNKFSYGVPIIKNADLDIDSLGITVPEGAHIIVGAVYEPLKADAHDDFMTEEEITKAMDDFIEEGKGSDIQHSNNEVSDIQIVKNWQLDEDMETTDYLGNSVTLAKGTWMAAALVFDEGIFSKVEKGDLTGWSMGGSGNVSSTDVEISEVEKGVITKLLEKFGLVSPIEKGQVIDNFNAATKENMFWEAWWALQAVIYPFVDYWTYERVFETDGDRIREALEDFNTILTEVLLNEDTESIIKSLGEPKESINKAGKKISGKNKQTIQLAIDSLNGLMDSISDDDSEEGEEMTKQERQEMVEDITKAVLAGMATAPEAAPELTPEEIAKNMVGDIMGELKKDLGLVEEEPSMADIIKNAVKEQLEPLLKAKNKNNQIEGEELEDDEIAKSEGGYMSTIKGGK